MTSLIKKKPSKDDLLDQVNIEFNDYESNPSSSIGSSLNSSPILSSVNSSGGVGGNNNGNFKVESNNWIVDLLVMIFGVDLRSLAAMRIGLSTLILLDLYVRSLYLHDHYTDLGVMPASTVIDNGPYYWSLYFFNSSYIFSIFLFIVNAIAGASLLVGYKTTLSNVVCWILMTSLHVRNPYVLNGGDDFFRLFVFWAMFLPCGAKFSIDSMMNLDYTNRKSNCLNPKSVTYSPINSNHGSLSIGGLNSKLNYWMNKLIPSTDSDGKYILSVASVAIQLQFLLVYILTAALKTGVEWWDENSAVWYALHLDQFATPLGIWLRDQIFLGQLLTWFTIRFEWIGPFLFFVPLRKLHGPIRTLGVLAFWCLHIGFGSCLKLGFFMYIPGMCALVFLPSWFWDNIVFNYLYSNSKSVIRTTTQIWINPSTNDSLYKCLSIFKQFFLLHSTPILIANHRNEDIEDNSNSISGLESSNSNSNSIYNEMKEKNYWLIIESSITGERVYGYDAFLTLISLSPTPIQYLNFWIFNRQMFKQFYSWLVCNPIFSNTKTNPMFSACNYVYPNTPVVKTRKWYKELFVLCLLIFVINWNLAGLYKYDVSPTFKWIGPVFKVEQYWSMFSPYPSKDNGWLVYPAILADGTQIDLNTGLPATFDRPTTLISSSFPTQRWRKYLMNLQGSGYRDKRLHYGRYLCRERNWYGKYPADKQLKSFKMIFMWELSPEFPYPVNNRTVNPQNPPEAIELWSHVC